MRKFLCNFGKLVNVATLLFYLPESAICSSFNASLTTKLGSINTTEYWAEDKPYTYQPHYIRLPSGKVVGTNHSNFSRLAEYRNTIKSKTPWISNWILSTEGRRTLKKKIPQMLMYNLVSPMDYGKSIRSGNVRRRRNKAIKMFLTDNLALPLLKSLGHVATNLFQTHYADYFNNQLFAQRLELMNASEIIQEFNLTLSTEVLNGLDNTSARPNPTLSYVYNGKSHRAALYAQYTTAFEPYAGYADQYYTMDDTFPAATFPADSYPWLWSPRIEATRAVIYELVELLTQSDQDNEENANSACSPICVEPIKNRFLRLLSKQAENKSTDESLPTVTPDLAFDGHDIEALAPLYSRLQEFHYDTGLPRLESRSNTSRGFFPLRTDFLQLAANSTMNNSNRDADGHATPDVRERSALYDALTHFYSYPVIDPWSTTPSTNCSVQHPCLVQSGVTVYTPSLPTGSVYHLLGPRDLAPALQRAVRLEVLINMTKVAFDAERRALKHGLQSPSTVWYSPHDLDVDEFADAVLGTMNLSLQDAHGDFSPLHVYEAHMKERVPLLDEVVSYYAATNHETTILMKNNPRIPILDRFEEDEVTQFIDTLHNQGERLARAIRSYVETRGRNAQYQAMVHATRQRDEYNGSEYTIVGFGFVMPATNDENVLYRDMKLPVPFHLILRLLVRFQESRLLLPLESRQLLVCLAMAYFDISFYRCRPRATPDKE